MAKTYEELKEMGWREPSMPTGYWSHKDGKIASPRQAGETDAEFRERLERNTPGLENEIDWVTVLRRAKNKRTRLQTELDHLEKEIERLTQEVREVSLWKITDMPEMSWWEMTAWFTNHPEIREFKAASHGNRVEFFGLASHGRPLLYVAMRVGWPEDMEGDDE